MISGPHQLSVRVGGIDIPGSPLTVQVKERGTPLCIIEGLNHPWGVALSGDGSVVVTEYSGHCVTVMDKEGEKSNHLVQKGQRMHSSTILVE